MARAFKQCLERRVQVNHRAAAAQTTSIVLDQHGAATGREHNIPVTRQFFDYCRFALAKPDFAFNLENERYRRPGARFDLMVRIEEGFVQERGERTANGGFARARSRAIGEEA